MKFKVDPRMGLGIGEPGDPCPTITSAHNAVARLFRLIRRKLPSAGMTANPQSGELVHRRSSTKSGLLITNGCTQINANRV
jgi:hypothetical protein